MEAAEFGVVSSLGDELKTRQFFGQLGHELWMRGQDRIVTDGFASCSAQGALLGDRQRALRAGGG